MDILVAKLFRNRFGSGDAFVARLVRQPGAGRAVADGPQALGLRAAITVDLDEALFHIRQLVEADVFGVRHDADSGDAVAEFGFGDLALAVLDLGLHALVRNIEIFDAGAGHDGHALLGQALLEEGRDILVFHRHDPVEHFDHGHIAAHVVVEAGELDTDRPAADDEQLLGHFLGRHGMAIGPHALAVRLGEGQVARPGTGGNDDVLGGELFLALIALDREAGRTGQRALAHVHGDLVLLHQMRDALIELLRDAAAALHDRVQIGLDLARDLEAVILRVLRVMEDFRRTQQRLGRNTAPVEADAAQQFAFHDGGFEPELRAADSRDIAAGSAAEHDYVVFVSHDSYLSVVCSPETWTGCYTVQRQKKSACAQRRQLAGIWCRLAPSACRFAPRACRLAP